MNARRHRLDAARSPHEERPRRRPGTGGQRRMEPVDGSGPLGVDRAPGIIPTDDDPSLRREERGMGRRERRDELPDARRGHHRAPRRADLHRQPADVEPLRRRRRHERQPGRLGERPGDVGAVGGIVGHPHRQASLGGEGRDRAAEPGRLRGTRAERIERRAKQHQRRRTGLTGGGHRHLEGLPGGRREGVDNIGRGAGRNRHRAVERRIEGEDDVCHGEVLQ